MEVHGRLGLGLLERPYGDCLAHELRLRGHVVETEVPVPLDYKGIEVGAAFRLDLFVDDLVIVKAKAIEALTTTHAAQHYTYLRRVYCPL